MKNLIIKNNLTIKGSGGGGGGGSSQPPPPPNVTQYPSVLAPPQFKNINSINSFSYAEIIDLISDGPIEGLINKNGKKVYDENIFEGIYLNDTPVKETSSQNKIDIDISFLKEKLKYHFSANGDSINKVFLLKGNYRKNTLAASGIDDKNFFSDITITSYHPSDSIYEFVNSLGGSFDSISLIERAFDLSPIISEKLFLTKINIPSFKFSAPYDVLDFTEGGSDKPYPIKLGINDLSNYIYFSIAGDNLTSFNYFEIPRSFVHNNITSAAGKKTFKKVNSNGSNLENYSAYDINIYIWSIYNIDIGIKNIDNILDRYFNKLHVFQNKSSLFNYNLIQSEFKNGSEIQSPLKYFTCVEIDTQYGKELIGPFCSCTTYLNPSNALSFGGVQRITSFSQSNSYLPPSTNLENINSETSDDIRYSQSWAIEYDCKGSPFLLCNAVLNYSNFDKTSSSRTSQDAIPVTHYILNENVESVYVTLNVNQLYDTNHVDLVSDNSSVLGLNAQSKYGQTTNVPQNSVNTYGDLLGASYTYTNSIGAIYFLVYNEAATSLSYIIDGYKIPGWSIDTPSCVFSNLNRIFVTTDPLYQKTFSPNGLCTKINDLQNIFNKKTWSATQGNNLVNYQIPNDVDLIKESISYNNIKSDTKIFQAVLNLLDDNGYPYYCYGLNENEILNGDLKYAGVTNSISTPYFPEGSFEVRYIEYKSVAFNNLIKKATVALIINSYIDWSSLIDYNFLNPIAISTLSINLYPNIFKYIINPYLYLNLKSGVTKNNYSKTIIGNLYLVGINDAYLQAQSLFFTDNLKLYLKIDILEQLLDNFLLTNFQTSNFPAIDSSDGTISKEIFNFSLTKALEQSLLKFENGKLIGSSSVFNFNKYTTRDISYLYTDPSNVFQSSLNIVTTSSATAYNVNNIFLYKDLYNSTSSKDVIFIYTLNPNKQLLQNSISTATKATYKDGTVDNYGAITYSDIPQARGNQLLQNISAGTKLPAIVVVDVETGYESQEGSNHKGLCEYFYYRYCIFGMSNDSAYIDLGRRSYDYVNSKKISADSGSYISEYIYTYSYDQPLYLIELICCSLGANKKCYFVTSIKNFYLGDMNLFKWSENSSLKISLNEQKGLNQIYDATLTNNTISSNYAHVNTVLSLYNITTIQLDDYFNLTRDENGLINGTVLDLGRFSSSTIFNSIFLRNPIFLSESYLHSKSKCTNNLLNYDTFCYVNNSTDYLQLNIYNFTYTAFKSIYSNSLWKPSLGYIDYPSIAEESTYLYFKIYTSNKGVNTKDGIYQTLKSYFNTTNDLILPFDSFVIRFYKNNTAGTPSDTIDLPQIYTTKLGFTTSVTASIPTSANTNIIQSNLTIATILEGINETAITKSIIDEIIINLDYINLQLYSNNFLLLGSNVSQNQSITADDITKSLNIASGKKLKVQFPSTFQKTWLGTLEINYSNYIQVKASDIRKSFNSYLYPADITVNVNFWTIFNDVTKTLTVVFKKGTRQNLYAEMAQFLDAIPLTALLRRFGVNQLTMALHIDSKRYGLTLVGQYDDSYTDYVYLKVDNKKGLSYTLPYAQPEAYFAGVTSSTYKNGTKIGLKTDANFATFYIKYYSDDNQTGGDNYVYLDGVPSSVRFVLHGLSLKVESLSSAYHAGSVFKFLDGYQPDLEVGIEMYDTDNAAGYQSYTLMNIDSPNGLNILSTVQGNLIQKGYISSDLRFATLDDSIYNYRKEYKSSNLTFTYYKGVPLTNNINKIKNTFAADIGTTIQIPKPKTDDFGNSVRRYVKITKKSHETMSPLISKRISLGKVTEIIPQNFSYPFSAIVGTKIDSRAFSQIPTRTFKCKLKKILVPSNYFINNDSEEDIRYLYGNGQYQIYAGDWDGTFKLAWSNNPAWVLMDLLINKRYGLGNYIESDQVDIWELYKISRWCDCVDDNGYFFGVDDGYGGTEPRHSFNAMITEKFNIFDMINQVASVFRGHVYYMNSLITFDDDRLKPIIGEFNNSDVKDGLFNYINHKKDDEYTAVDVAFIDAKDEFRSKIEYVEDSNGIRQRGLLKKQINAFGVTSKAQARRYGKYFLYQTSKENTNVSFVTDNRALLYRPGDLIKINDELFNSIKNFGSIKCITNIDNYSFKITIDKKLDSTIYDDSEVSIYTPIAKPKYDDYYADAQSVPSDLVFSGRNPLIGTSKFFENGQITTSTTSYNGAYYGVPTESNYIFNLRPFDTTSPIKSFSGSVNATYNIFGGVNYATNLGFINKIQTGYFNYIANNNINQESSKYGHWEFSIDTGVNRSKLLFDVIIDEAIKYQLPYKNYFFKYFDTGRYMKFSGLNSNGGQIYYTSDFNPKEIKYLQDFPNKAGNTETQINTLSTNFNLTSYDFPKIHYTDIIKNDSSSVETFYITGYDVGTNLSNNEILNEYTEIYLTKSGKSNSTSIFNKIKDVVNLNLNNLMEGSQYSLNLLNSCERIFKITSITENYINEYNLFASEYNLNKFKEIEDNSQKDSLSNTYNFLTAHNTAKQFTHNNTEQLAAPVIFSLIYVIYQNAPSIEIKWGNVENADSFEIFIQTPSKQTSNYLATATYASDYNPNISSYVKVWPLPANKEIGTYTITIRSKKSLSGISNFSALTKKAVTILTY